MAAEAPTPSKFEILYQGALHKRGQVHRTWKQRWFVLQSDFKLRYYESKTKSEETFIDKPDRNVLGAIDALQIERIEVSALLDTDKSRIPKSIKLADKKGHDKEHDEALPSMQTSMISTASSSSRSLLISLVTSSRTYKLSAEDTHSFVEWLRNLDRYLYGGVVFESFLDKKGSDHKAFKRRYFAANRYRQIKYYNNEHRETLHGVIDLNDDSLSVQYSVNEHLIELRSEKRKWILYAKEEALYRKWAATLRSLKDSKSATVSFESLKSPSSSKPLQFETLDPALWAAPDEVVIDKKPGDVFREWIKAQKELKRGDQPTVCTLYGVRLKQMGKARRKGTTVADLQIYLKGAGVGRRTHFGTESADYTDNEWSDDEDEDDDDDDDEDLGTSLLTLHENIPTDTLLNEQ